MASRLAIDIGGTFTDVVLASPATSPVSVKVLTTYDDPANAVLTGLTEVLARAQVPASDVELVLHGTTLATNALIERRGAVTALLTTAGHRDALEMAFENRFEQYDINIDRPQPLVPRHLRLPVVERLAADGEVLLPLDENSLAAQLEIMRAAGVQSVAVGFLHAYANSQHEQRTAELVSAALPDVAVTLASEVCPEIREFERLSTAAANAYVKPLMATYLTSLQTQLQGAGINCPVLLMTSGGGLTTLDTARRFPIRLVESGPAGGAILAAHIAHHAQLDRVLSFDMGGTTAKICLIDDGAPQLSRAFEVDRTYRFKKGSGLPVRIPVIEMVEIGAGGGSIAGVDRLQRLTVGPESAGSEPGPAAYGRGGVRATVTDADVVLGKLEPGSFAGGRMQLDVTAAQRAVLRDVGETLSLSAPQAALGVQQIVDENMAAAARAHAVEWGKDLRNRTMVAFGGAAPLHAASLAGRLKMQRVLVPAGAGVGSAIGFLLAPVSFEVVRSRYMQLLNLDAAVIEGLYRDMYDEAAAVVKLAAPAAQMSEVRRAYMRYVGQGYEVAVTLPAGGDEAVDATASAQELPQRLRDLFETRYRALYGRTIANLPVEVLSWTLTLADATRDDQGVNLSRPPQIGSQQATNPAGSVAMFDGERAVDAPFYQRDQLAAGVTLDGPALVVETQTTTVVPQGWSCTVLDDGMLQLQMQAGHVDLR